MTACCALPDEERSVRFFEALARPHVFETAMGEGYRAMNDDRQREAEASEWIDGLIGDAANAAR